MAKFEHHRYPAVAFHDHTGKWAQFTPQERSFGEHTIKVGVLDTDDEATIARLRAAIAAGGDEHLKEVDAPGADADGDEDELSGLDKDALLSLADEEGVTVDKRWGVDKLADAIREHRSA